MEAARKTSFIHKGRAEANLNHDRALPGKIN